MLTYAILGFIMAIASLWLARISKIIDYSIKNDYIAGSIVCGIIAIIYAAMLL